MTDRQAGWRSRIVRALGLAIVLLLGASGAAFLWAGPAFAHAALISSEPAAGSVVPAAPTSFVLNFSEPVSVTALRLVDADGHGLDLPDARAQNQSVTVAAPPIADGTHALSWRVISADGHPVGGTLIFSVGTASPSGFAVPSGASSLLIALVWGTRLILYVALFTAVGGMGFAAWTAAGAPLPPVVGRTLAALGIVGLMAALAGLGLQGLDMLGADFPRLTDVAVWREALSSSYAITLGLDGAALGLALLALRLAGQGVRRAMTAAALLLLGAAVTASGHVSTAPPELLTRSAIFVHVVCLALWLGALLPLAALLRSDTASATTTLRRFSRLAPIPVALIVLSGLIMAIIQLQNFAALWTTSYGLIFDLKLGAVLILLGLGALNRYRLTRRTIAGEAAARRAMVRSIAAEMALAVAILGLVASWRFTPPPRVLETAVTAAPAPVRLHILGPTAMADLVIAPGRAGPSSIEIAVLDAKFRQLDAKGVTLTLANPTAGLEPIAAEARHLGGANWIIDLETIPVPGQWTVKVDILISDFDAVTLEQTFELPR